MDKLEILANMLAHVDINNWYELTQLSKHIHSISQEEIESYIVINPDAINKLKRMLYKATKQRDKDVLLAAFRYATVYVFPDIKHMVKTTGNIHNIRKQLFYKNKQMKGKIRNNPIGHHKKKQGTNDTFRKSKRGKKDVYNRKRI
jgi:hypothetical protein